MVAGGEDAGGGGGCVRNAVVAVPPPDGDKLRPGGKGQPPIRRPVVHALREDLHLHQLVILFL